MHSYQEMNKELKNILAISGGLILAGWVLKKLWEDKEYHKCPRCNYPVKQSILQCTHCGQPLAWGDKNKI